MTPAVTIAVIATRGGAAVERTLAAVNAIGLADVEVIVVSPEHAPPGGVRWIAAGAAASVYQMRTSALRAATGGAIVLLSDRYIPSPGWLAAIRTTVGAGDTGTFWWGPIAHDATTAPERARHYAEYGAYSPGGPTAPPRVIAAANVWFGSRVRDLLVARAASGTELAWTRALREHRIPMVHVPAAIVHHHDPVATRAYVRERYHVGRSIARERLRDASPMARGMYALRTIALPPVLVARWVSDAWRRPAERTHALGSLPWLTLFACAAAAGELDGCARTTRR